MTIELRGITAARAIIKGTKKEIRRANTNAANTMASQTKKEFTKGINQATGVKAKFIRRNQKTKRANTRRQFSVLQAKGSRISLREWPQQRIIQVHPTRARVEVRSGLEGGFLPVYAFVNPLGASRAHLTRYVNELIVGGLGVSIVRAFDQIVDRDVDDLPDKYENVFLQKLQDQINKRK